MTATQKNLVEAVKASAPNRHPLRVARGGFKTADVLIAQGVLRDATLPTDATRFVILV